MLSLERLNMLKSPFLFAGARKSVPKKTKPGLHYGRDLKAVPLVAVAPPSRGPVTAAFTGPNAGLTALDPKYGSDSRESGVEIADCKNWNQPSEFAFGISLSLYEEDRSAAQSSAPPPPPPSGAEAAKCTVVGDPVADVFGVQVRENLAVLALADGAGWGPKPRLAARCAVRAVMEHVTASLSEMRKRPTSHTVSSVLLESVAQKAQELILEHNATLTTLSAAVVVEMTQPGEWGLFVVAVGDSPMYVYCPHSHKTQDVTVGCHAEDGQRDMRCAGGTLGPTYGTKPDLENLTVAFMTLHEGDIVLGVSDGISDNFSGQAVSMMTGLVHPDIAKGKVKPCCDSILHLNEVLGKHHDELRAHLSAQTVVTKLLNYVVEFTEPKREFYSHCLEKGVNIKQRRNEDPDFAREMEMLHGKLDHATVVAYQVGRHPKSPPPS
jgi:serine/threonine protein phosphatase PrpC